MSGDSVVLLHLGVSKARKPDVEPETDPYHKDP